MMSGDVDGAWLKELPGAPVAGSRVAVALSGGVDSATAAALLKEAGYEVIGLTMQLWDHGQNMSHRSCCSLEDVYDARKVAQRLDIPFYVVNLEEAFFNHVVQEFLQAPSLGRTPNPCARCNQILKFDLLLKKSLALEASFMATGHYAVRQQSRSNHFELWQASDQRKDQSYFLFAVTQQQLAHLLFPLGSLTKQQTRQLADRYQLAVAQKAESQDLCFIPDGHHAAFLARHAPQLVQPGDIVEAATGRRLGQHQGIGLYTIGQRKGLRLACAHPLYVVAVDPGHNRLLVGPREELFRSSCLVGEVNWLGDEPLTQPIAVLARIRYAATSVAADIIPLTSQRVRVDFAQPQSAITQGQACVFYDGHRLLGGGWIDQVL